MSIVLIVDDDKMLRRLIATHLQKASHSVTAGLDYLGHQHARMDGTKAIQELR